MVVISKTILREFGLRHPDAIDALNQNNSTTIQPAKQQEIIKNAAMALDSSLAKITKKNAMRAKDFARSEIFCVLVHIVTR